MPYPFTAIRGQERLKKALILNVINPKIGGVLISGHKGTAKSTAVRSLAQVAGKNVITLPLSATEDRVVGSIDLEKTIITGTPVFQPGILSEVHNGILYIDEVNLLQDHLVNMVLCAHSSKVNRLEREGISCEEPCEFVLIGTMNPEEGKLKSHFLEEFGLVVDVKTDTDPENRILIVKDHMAYEQDADAFLAQFADAERELQWRIQKAIALLDAVTISDHIYQFIIDHCLMARVQGHGADLIMVETVKALAAWDGRLFPEESDVEEAASYVLIHRMMKAVEDGNQSSKSGQSKQKKPETPKEEIEKPQKDKIQDEEPQSEGDTPVFHKKRGDNPYSIHAQNDTPGNNMEEIFSMGQAFLVKNFGHKKTRKIQTGSGKRTDGKSGTKRGHYIYSVKNPDTTDFALDATIRAAAPYQLQRERNGVAIEIHKSDLCGKVRESKYGNLLVFVLDASGSMAARKRMIETKAAILSILKDAYVKRDTVSLVTFRRNKATVMLPPTRSVDRGIKLLEGLAVGGKTPLNHGIIKGLQVIESERMRNPKILPYLIIISDGIGNVSIDKIKKPKEELMQICSHIKQLTWLNTMVLDIERKGTLSQNIGPLMAERMGSDYEKLDTIRSAAILSAVERMRHEKES